MATLISPARKAFPNYDGAPERIQFFKQRGLAAVISEAEALGLTPLDWNEQSSLLTINVPLTEEQHQRAKGIVPPPEISLSFSLVRTGGGDHPVAHITKHIPPLQIGGYDRIFSLYALSCGIGGERDSLFQVIQSLRAESCAAPVVSCPLSGHTCVEDDGNHALSDLVCMPHSTLYRVGSHASLMIPFHETGDANHRLVERMALQFLAPFSKTLPILRDGSSHCIFIQVPLENYADLKMFALETLGLQLKRTGTKTV